jgi:hypothetical protein
MEILVTQYVRPNGVPLEICIYGMPDWLTPILEEITKAGLHLEAEVLTTGEVSFTLAHREQEEDFDIEICNNTRGPHGTKAGLIRLIERFDKKKFAAWLEGTPNMED